MYGFQIGQLIVVGVDTDTKEEPSVASVDDFQVTELDEIGLMLLVARGDETMDLASVRIRWCSKDRGCYLAFELDFLVILHEQVRLANCVK